MSNKNRDIKWVEGNIRTPEQILDATECYRANKHLFHYSKAIEAMVVYKDQFNNPPVNSNVQKMHNGTTIETLAEKFEKIFQEVYHEKKGTYIDCMQASYNLRDNTIVDIVKKRIVDIEGNGHTVLTTTRVDELTNLLSLINK